MMKSNRLICILLSYTIIVSGCTTAFDRALINNDVDGANALISRGEVSEYFFDLRVANECRKGNIEMAALLMDRRADISHKFDLPIEDLPNIPECVFEAVEGDQYETLEWALEEGFPVDQLSLRPRETIDNIPILSVFVPDIHTVPLRQAIKHKRNDMVKLLIERGASTRLKVSGFVESVDFYAIHEAIDNDNNAALQIILESGASPNLIRGFWDETPVVTAVKARNIGAIKLLVNNGAFLNYQDDFPLPLTEANKQDNREIYLYLRQNGALTKSEIQEFLDAQKLRTNDRRKSETYNKSTSKTGERRQSQPDLTESIIGALVVIAGVALIVAGARNQNSRSPHSDFDNYQRMKSADNSKFGSITASSTRSCSSDYACGVGDRCVKAPMSTTGICLKSVSDYGVPDYPLPDPDSFGVETEGSCLFSSDCPAGFWCDASLKACVKH